MSNWEKRRATVTVDELMGTTQATPTYTAPPASPSPAAWAQSKVAAAPGWPWREISGTVAVCLLAAVVIVMILNSGWTLPSLPRRRAEAPPLPTAAPSPVVVERVIQVEQPPVVVVVTATPAPPAPVVAPPQPRRQAAPRPQPVEAAPAASHPARVNIFFVCAQGPVRMMDKSWSEYSANLGRHDLTVSGNTNSPSGPWMGWSGCTITGYEPAN